MHAINSIMNTVDYMETAFMAHKGLNAKHFPNELSSSPEGYNMQECNMR